MKNSACLMFPQKVSKSLNGPVTHDIILVCRDHCGYVMDHNTA